MTNQVLAGKVAIVTGAAGGIGLAVARRLASEGASLMMVDVRPCNDQLAQLPDGAAQRGACMTCDVSDETAVAALVEAVLAQFGRVDIIVNVAGVITYRPIAELTAADWWRVLGVNLVGAAMLISHGFRWMKPGSTILNIGSVHAERTVADVAPYAASKAALESLTRSAAIEGAALGIRANAILPGAVDTAMLRANPNIASGVETFDPAEVGTPDDIAEAALYLVCDASRFVTGASLAVDGGLLARL